MTPRTIGLIQVKGGTARSTVATNLAGELSKLGKTVLIDCDMPQGTSASWYALREQAGLTGNLIGGLQADTATSHRELIAKVQRYEDADYIVLDGPPRIAEITRAILVLADLCLIPVGASAAEIWATGDILELITGANKVKPVNARLVWTRHRPNTRLAQDLTDLASKELSLRSLESTLGMRVAYMSALGEGLTVAEMPDLNARAEVSSLVQEVRRILRKKA